MIVQYNGVDLEVERVVGWSDRIVYSEDNMERMYRHVSMVVQCVVHPMATTISALQPVTGSQVVVDLKRRLLEPRKLLRVRIAGNEVLRSPALVARPDLPGTLAFGGDMTHYCDAKGGPHPLYVDVVSIHGTKTLLVTFSIETWLVDSSALEAQPADDVETDTNIFSAMISHRWTQSNSIDTNYYNTRTISGRAVFRADYLYDADPLTGGLRQIAAKPSDFLSELNHTLPPNYKRESVRAEVSSDGLAITYTIVDVEQHSTVQNGRPITSVRGVYRAGLSQGMSSIPGVPDFPRYYKSFSVTVTGRRGATKEQLLTAAIKAAMTFDKNFGLKRRAYWDNSITFNFGSEAPYAQYSTGYDVSGVAPAIVEVAGWGWGGAFENALFKGFPEQINGGLGDPLSVVSQGQQPQDGMIGSTSAGQPGGGQRRLNTQQILDGQYVPPHSPHQTTLQEDNVSLEPFTAQLARGDDFDTTD